MTETVAATGSEPDDGVGRRLVRRPLPWTLCTALVLSLGFIAIVFAMTQLVVALRPDTEVRTAQTALVLYGRVVLAKVLWPHVALTAPLYLLLQNATKLGEAKHLHQCLGFMAVASVTAAVLTALLLPSDAFGMPAIRPAGAGRFLATVVELAAGTTAAAALSRWLLDRVARD